MSHLTLSQAQTIIAAALANARAHQYKPMGVVVLDASGHLVAFAREEYYAFKFIHGFLFRL